MSKSKKEQYTQCKLKNGTSYSIAFIPKKFATIGKEIIVTKGSTPLEWIVAEVYRTVSLDEIKNQSHNSGDIWTATSGPCPRGNK